jgi:hypothetical protein
MAMAKGVRMTDRIAQEWVYRWQLWQQLHEQGGPMGVSPQRLRTLGLYGGAQGIWVDKARTATLTADGVGITVGVLHTGTAYADDLSEDGILYHYPHTHRPSARDRAEIQATKAAGSLGLPLFVMTGSGARFTQRNVHLGWVKGWDDEAQLFLITFGETRPLQLLQGGGDERPFVLVEPRAPVRREVAARQGQQRFKFLVLQRYGVCCAVCDLRILEVLDAAHLRPKHMQGSDDPRNGLVFCAVHHRAFDAGFFAIEPRTLRVHCRPLGPDASALQLRHLSLAHLSKYPLSFPKIRNAH